MRVINERGPDVTMEEIAAEATVTKPILYRTIGDKDALVAALSESLVDRINIAVADASGPSGDPRSDFEAAVRTYLRAIDNDRNLFLFVNAGRQGTDQLRGLVDRSSTQLIDLFAAALPREARYLTPARTWAYAIIGSFQIVTIMWLHDEYCTLDELSADLSELIWTGVSTIGPPRNA